MEGLLARIGSLGGGGRHPRRALVLAFLGVLLPLALLLALQYLWLADLERSSRLARRATLAYHLELITEKVEWFYSKRAEAALAVPADVFAAGTEDRIEAYVLSRCECGRKSRAKKVKPTWPVNPTEGALMLFYAGFRGECGELHAYDPARNVETKKVPAAVHLARLYWSLLAKKSPKKISVPPLSVDERDPAHPLIISLQADDDGLLGLAGLVVDVRYFVDDLVPILIHKSLAKHPDRDDLAVAVWDSEGHVRVGDPGARVEDYELKRRFQFVFTDWTIGVRSRRSTSAEWARANFLFNVTLSTFLALVLLGGTALAMRAAAREMRLSEMKSDFVSNVSHELRTPLSSIRVFGELMRLGRVQEREKIVQYGEYIESEGRRLSRLIDNILDFSKIESGQRVYRFEDEDLLAIVEDVVKTFDVRLRQGEVRIEVQTPPEALPVVCVDAGALGHAIGNLIDNAIKYGNGARQIIVRLAVEQREVRISVRDHGVGIPSEEHERIFERFHRVGSSLVHDVRGSGLGLAIVKHIVEAHGGRVSLSSAPGKGSEFTLHLPEGGCGERGPIGVRGT